jgi:hypothetical protein
MAIRTLEPEMIDSPDVGNPRAGIGGNKPPLEELIPAEFRAQLLAERPDFLAKFDALVEAAARAKATNDDELGKCGDLVKAYRALIAHITETHKTVKQPHLDAGRLVDAEKNALLQQVEAAKATVESIGNAFVAKRDAEAKAERDRIAAEQRAAAERVAQAERDRVRAEQEAAAAARNATNDAEREAAQAIADNARREAEEAAAAAALAPAAAAKVEPVRSDAGATVSGKQEWMSRVDDHAKAMKAVKSDPKVKEAIEAAVARLVRAGQREIPGCTIWAVAKANFR